MKVHQLITLLQRQNLNIDVVVGKDENGYWSPEGVSVEKIDIEDGKSESVVNLYLNIDNIPSSARIKDEDKGDFVNLNKVDYEKQTITLGSKDNPAHTLATGHLNGREFAKKWEDEGWDGPFDKTSTDKDVKNFENGLEHSYGKIMDNNTWEWGLDKDLPCVIPVTILTW